MNQKHSLLIRQLKKHGGASGSVPEGEFLRAIDAAYRQADDERALLERALELTSQEMLRDLDELRRAKESLFESQVFLEKAQEVAKLGSWAAPLGEGGALLLSKECRRICGLDGDAPMSFERYLDLVHPEDRASVLLVREGAIRDGKAFSHDYRINRPDGALRWVHSRADVVRDDAGASVKLIGIIQDITNQRELEDRLRQSQKMEAVGRLAGGVAHDFNNILTAIKGYSAFLKSAIGGKDAGLRADVEEIEKAADRAAALTHQLLAFSRKQVLQPVILDINATVAGLEGMMRCLIREDIKVASFLKPGIGRIEADPGQISQVVMNLIVNARDAMPDGGTIRVETDDAEAGDSPLGVKSVRISVADAGTGMEPSVLSRIFEPFFTTKERGKGTGLGLSTVYGIVAQSGGHVAVESAPGRGTRFSVYLPRVEEPADAKASPVWTDAEPARGRGTVLVVEDEQIVRTMICRALRDQGYEVVAAAGGEEALRTSAAHPARIDLLLTDIIMPGMNGRALAERAATVRPEMRVLYMSGYTDDVIARHGVLEPGTPFVQKPFSPRVLAEKVREAIQKP